MTTTKPDHRIQIVECPRDAMQGWNHPIATPQKVEYIQQLRRCNFSVLDMGSFVSPQAIPQMADTSAVLDQLVALSPSSKKEGISLDIEANDPIEEAPTKTDLLVIVANKRGAEQAALRKEIKFQGFPFSLSETFQQRNTNRSQTEALSLIQDIQSLAAKVQQELVVYLSMGFGNPYGDPYHPDLLVEWTEKIKSLGVSIISVADTVGLAQPIEVYQAVHALQKEFPSLQIGVHLHAPVTSWQEKITAALEAGCRRIDGAVLGLGGCPLSGSDLIGNIPTHLMVPWLHQQGWQTGVQEQELEKAVFLARKIFI